MQEVAGSSHAATTILNGDFADGPAYVGVVYLSTQQWTRLSVRDWGSISGTKNWKMKGGLSGVSTIGLISEHNSKPFPIVRFCLIVFGLQFLPAVV